MHDKERVLPQVDILHQWVLFEVLIDLPVLFIKQALVDVNFIKMEAR